MPTPAKTKSTSMSDAAVKAKTSKTWPQWFSILDKVGGKKMTHKQLVAALSDQHDVGPWWQQTIAVEYERARGLRANHQTVSGYSISRSKTLNVPVARAFKAWNDKPARSRWMTHDGFTVRKATANRSMRITWIDGTTNVEVMFYPKSDAKCQVTVQHSKLSDAKTAAKMKNFWGDQLDRLQATLEN